MKVGASKVDITPPIGIPLGGYIARMENAKGIHDNLHVRSLMISGEEDVLLLSFELLHLENDFVKETKQLIRKELGIKEDNILAAAIHTHSGPSPSSQYGVAQEYFKLLPNYALTAAKQAFERLDIAKVGYGKGRLDGWTVNRRKPYEGPLDNEVIVVRFEDEKERLIASVINFTCHAVVLGHNNLLVSADYPGYTSMAIEQIEGGVALFLNGACGDINPLTPRTDLKRVYDRSIGTFEEVRKMGFSLAGEALKLLNSVKTFDTNIVRVLTKEVSVKRAHIPKVTNDEITKLRELYEKLLKDGKMKEALNAKIKYSQKVWLKALAEKFPEPYVSINIQGIRIGDLIIIALPGEVLVEIGLAIKEKSKTKYTMIVGYANGYIGYIPTRKAVREGDYEGRPPATVLTEDAEEKIIETSLEIIGELLE